MFTILHTFGVVYHISTVSPSKTETSKKLVQSVGGMRSSGAPSSEKLVQSIGGFVRGLGLSPKCQMFGPVAVV